jgi:hypothetical protein
MKNKVKTHIKNNKVIYIVAVNTIVVAGITWLIMRDTKELHAALDAGTDCPKGSVDSFSFFSGW